VRNDFTEAQRVELLRLVRALKEAGLATAALDGPVEVLRELAVQAEALVGALTPVARHRDGTWPFAAVGPGPTDLPFNPVSGPYNPLSPEIAFNVEGSSPEHVVARVRFSQLYEGPPTLVHGGWIAATFDQVLGIANHVNGVGGLTGSLTTRYTRPTPINAELRFDAWPARIEERKVLTHGECRLDGVLLSECDGVFIRLDAERAARLFGG
jgi:acyl-coenzyme A thioesterase PaaI-like protein